MKSYAFITILLISCIFISGGVLARQTVLLSTINWPPYTGENLPKDGFISEIVTEAFAEVGYDVEYHYRPWPRALQEAKNGSVHGVMTAYWKKERTEYLQYPDEVVWKVPERFFALPSNPITYSGKTTDLLGYTIGVLRGSLQSDHLVDSGVGIEAVNDHAQNILKLSKGRIDAMLASEGVLEYKLRSVNSQGKAIKLKMLDSPYKVYDMYVAFSKSHSNYEKLSEDFSRGLKLLKLKGKFDKIAEQARSY